MSRRLLESVVAAASVVLVLLAPARLDVAAARTDVAAARTETAPGEPPEHAERVARDVVDELGLDKPPDEQQPRVQSPAGSAFGAVGHVLAYLLVGAAAAGIGYAIVALVRSAGGRRSRDGGDEEDAVDVETGTAAAADDIEALTAAQWRERAATAEAAGRCADAVRFLHYAGLLGLDEDGLVEFEPGRPNGEYVHIVADLAPGAAPEDLRHLNRLMEDATFGHYEMGPDAVQWSRSGWTRVREAFVPRATV